MTRTMTPVSELHKPEQIQDEPSSPEFKPSKRLYVAFLTLAVITLMVALDGTSLSVALPVSEFVQSLIIECQSNAPTR